jgi:hypothetical protein
MFTRRSFLNLIPAAIAGAALAKKCFGNIVTGEGQAVSTPQLPIFPKEKALSDAFDDLHIHNVCFAFGTSPQRLLKMQNRATSESNQDTPKSRERMESFVTWLQDLRKQVDARMA